MFLTRDGVPLVIQCKSSPKQIQSAGYSISAPDNVYLSLSLSLHIYIYIYIYGGKGGACACGGGDQRSVYNLLWYFILYDCLFTLHSGYY